MAARLSAMDRPAPSPSANLQTGLTVKQIAEKAGVSERMIYMARELCGTGREDLCDKVVAGELSLIAALKFVKPEKYDRRRSRTDALVRAWNACTDDERAMFIARVLAEMDP